MGLLDIFLQNQSNLDITPVPPQGNGPVGTPTGEFNAGTTPFSQTWNSNNTYVNSFEGGTNVGIQPPTLAETGLDVDNPDFIQSTSTPNTLTYYPATALGGLGQSALQFIQIWNPIINYNDVVVGADTSPLEQSLNQTGLDNTDPNAVPTTVTPSTTTNYPSLATGEYNSVSNQYAQSYTSNNTYLNSFNPNTQVNSLSDTGLDIENIGLVSTTAAPNFNTDYPSLSTGEFNGQSNNFNQPYTPNNTYLNTFNPQTQPNTLNQTGLDIEDTNAAPTTVTPVDPTSYPQFVQGEFNGAPTQYNQIWNPTNQYIINYNSNTQPNTLSQTGLDSDDPNFVSTTTTPNTITQYPPTSTGEFGGISTQYTQIWNSNNTYNTNYNPNIQPDTLSQTGLDIENQNAAPTTIIPTDPTQYPQFVQGEFNGAPLLYIQNWNPNNRYFTVFNPINGNTNQITTLAETGLDIENENAAPTTYIVPITDDTFSTGDTPSYVHAPLAINNSAPRNYTQTWLPNNEDTKYYDYMRNNFQLNYL